ncbi:TetR/AcrR family transcriptional regulator [Deinococcus wulumuqiensis]|uniref:TetR/AcrR family transcriptional regulator n=1 Tax=Deinococcus wulumuqiensis TaxID=980427 RepID=A0A345IIX4_9DEIO|nr:TetR/AcrR family transcriptional regulator [Deinococcus wulumuqiensis]AXG99646.1 TetR/AcrR family transcriptional regulator [Deinococcus wulumuqiensis]
MTALPRRLSAPERRQQILDMAASLFVERGFESVTVADLAHELQTSRPTIYSYFPSTEAILDELLGQRLSGLLSRLDPLLRDLSPDSPPSNAAEVVFRFLLGEADTLRLLHSGGAPTFQARRHAFLSQLGERLTLSPELLLRRQPELLLLITTLLDSLALRAVTDPSLDADRLARSLNTFVVGGAQALRGGHGSGS